MIGVFVVIQFVSLYAVLTNLKYDVSIANRKFGIVISTYPSHKWLACKILIYDNFGYCHKDFNSGNILQNKVNSYISDLEPYIVPEVLNGEPYILASDIYNICNGLRPEFGKGIPEFYKKLAYRCMNENPNQRPTSDELHELLYFADRYYTRIQAK
ncbi:18949_t:CDS:2 [Funneliformis geosporum]|uniref:18949_t:CDS:1 n=1 Tax=Funneliformis geosporum TaxID=1117311 RepID=A0A9W4SN49_9GLOM|nr:18949_t:CDS:2 [Funneliformis geosporum]